MASELLQGRLHPATLITAVLEILRRAAGSVVPILAVAVLGGRGFKGGFSLIVVGLSALGLVASLGFALVRYFTFTYSIDETELQTQEGIWWKHERRIPLARIQDIRLEQNILHRLFKVAALQVETAGGSGAEASLSVISLTDAERLRAYLFAHREVTPAVPAFDLELPPAPATPELVLRAVTLKELMIAGLTQSWLGTAMAGLGGVIFWLREYLPRRAQSSLLRTGAETASGWLSSSGVSLGLGIALIGLLVLLTGMGVSIVRTILLFYGFKLTRTGEDLSRAYGLLNRHVSRLPRRRIQVLEIEQSPLRRFVGVAVLRADTAGSIATHGKESAHNTGRDVLVPLLSRDAVDALLPELLPGLSSESPVWQPISPLAIRREALPGTYLCLILSLGLSLFLSRIVHTPLWPLGLIPLVFLPFLWLASRWSWKQLGWALDGAGVLLRVRRGVLNRSEYLVPLRNLQVIKVRQSPFDRRLGLLSLHVDTAGQTLTGGGPRLDHVPQEEGWRLVRSLAREAQRQRFRWEK